MKNELEKARELYLKLDFKTCKNKGLQKSREFTAKLLLDEVRRQLEERWVSYYSLFYVFRDAKTCLIIYSKNLNGSWNSLF